MVGHNAFAMIASVRVRPAHRHHEPRDGVRYCLRSLPQDDRAIHANIESLYHDLFIETCDDWVIPYSGDLLGTSHLKGDPWTLRADVLAAAIQSLWSPVRITTCASRNGGDSDIALSRGPLLGA